MQTNPEEILSILKQRIEGFTGSVDVQETGQVIMVGDGIARVHGLENVMAGELVEFPGGVLGMAMNLEEDNVGCVMFSGETEIREGGIVKRTGRIVEIPVGDELLGRVVNPLGIPRDGRALCPSRICNTTRWSARPRVW